MLLGTGDEGRDSLSSSCRSSSRLRSIENGRLCCVVAGVVAVSVVVDVADMMVVVVV